MTTPIGFALQPFGGASERQALGLQRVEISGEVAVERRGEEALLRISYRLVAQQGSNPEAVLIPAPVEQPGRRDGLWQHTCLEAFVGAVDGAAYWEVNLAPSGDWALYRFDGYRDGQHSPPITGMPFGVEPASDHLLCRLVFPLPRELAAASQLTVGISAVLEQRNGSMSYWALHHPGSEADFHRRDGFTLRL
jgi:hypothetical protein